jgi:uncharacterized protein (TIRG00374 family)
METISEAARRRGIPKWLLPVLGYGISAASLIWVFAKFPFATLGEHLHKLSWTWVAIAVATELLVYFADAWRWMALLRPVGAPPFWSCLQAVFVGLFANDILPAKTGEVIRCFLLSYKNEIPLPIILTSDVILRIMDGLWIVLMYAAITSEISAHHAVDRVMLIFGAGAMALGAILLWILFHRQHAHHFMNKRSWGARFVHLMDEIHRLGHWRELGISMAIGGLYWILQALAIWAICRADQFEFGAAGVMFLLLVKTVFTVAPSAPANVGLYQSSSVYALGLLLTERAQADVLVEIMFVILTLPLVVGGAVAIASAGFNLSDLHRHAHIAHREHRAQRPAGKQEPS